MDKTWTLVEPASAFKRRLGQDAIFTLGNGYLGCRGFFDEEQEGAVETLGGIYMAGVFGRGALKAWTGMDRELVNTPNFFWTSIRIDGEQLLQRPGRIRAFRRTLDMQHGTVTRSFVWTSARGKRVSVRFERFISIADLHRAGQRIVVCPLEAAVDLELVAGIDAGVTQHNMVTTIPLPVQPGRPHLKLLAMTADSLRVQVETLPDGVCLSEGQSLALAVGNAAPEAADATRGARLGTAFRARLQPGNPATLAKVVTFYTSRDGDDARLLADAMREPPAYETLLADHCRAWEHRWHDADIEIEGAADDQQAVRFNLFQLMQACPRHDSRVSLGARGLSGEMHEGSIFWDNEIFKLPFFTFTDPDATRSMLRFRHRTLPAARRHARELWFEGAMYAWKSGDDGVEETEMGVGAYYAIHIVADIAYALRQYWEATGDDAFLFRYGTEILLETARFWQSRLQYNPAIKACEIRAVRGPNEYDVIVHNNAFTNQLARENLLFAAESVARMKREQPAAWRKLATRCAFREEELKAWRLSARRLLIPYDRRRDLYLEDDAYLRRAPFDRARGKPDARRVIDSTLPYEAMPFYQITKQSDVITMMNLLPARFTPAQMKRAYAFYEPRTVHDSSLSYAPHAVMAARLGLRDEAYRYFRDCAYLDLADIQLNTICGLHFANLGGTWQAVVMGFAGLWQADGVARLAPHLPARWKALRFRLRLQGGRVQVEMRGKRTRLTLETPGPAPTVLVVGRNLVELHAAGETVTV